MPRQLWLHATCKACTCSVPRPKLYSLSRVCVADSNKTHLLVEDDTRVLDACAEVLSWGMPGASRKTKTKQNKSTDA